MVLKEFLGLKNEVLFSSCRNALHALLLSLGFKEGDEVILQDFICDSVTIAITKANLKPVFIKVDKETLNLNANEVAKKITKKTKALVFVHTYGNTTGIDKIKILCDERNIVLIEDIAHALGAMHKGRLAGTLGDYAVYSFTKQMVNFGGGAVISNNNLDGVKRLRRELNKGRFNIIDGMKRLFGSLYETRAFIISKIMIDIARSNADLKLTNSLSKHYTCSWLERYLVRRQIMHINNNNEKRRNNFEYIKRYIKTQKMDVESSCNYICLMFESKEKRDIAIKMHKLLLPVWPNSSVSDYMAFVPNNPRFKKKQLDNIISCWALMKPL